MKVWYYKPWAFHPKVNPQYVFDAQGRNVTEVKDEDTKHPLHKTYKIKIKNSMVEVPQ